ncbi:MAG: hypothetical protein KAJ24_08020 [Candidatus Aenigmarchaeota archaeon]|nr:hypothetical protein [Candidatus Aenigmarchaeota archaeon]
MIMELSDNEKNTLKEMWSLSSSGAISALASTLGKEVKLVEPCVKQMLLNDVPGVINADESGNILIYLKLSGAVKGVAAISAAPSNILALADMLLHKEIGTFKTLDNQNFSVVNELLNILTGYYVDAIVARISGKITMREPTYSVNAYKAIDDFGLGETFKEIKVLVFENKFIIPEVHVTGKTFLILSEKVLKKFL